MGCNDFRVGLEQVNQMRDLFSGDSPIVNRRRYRGHGCSDVVHAVDAWQLQIKWATAALWQKAAKSHMARVQGAKNDQTATSSALGANGTNKCE